MAMSSIRCIATLRIQLQVPSTHMKLQTYSLCNARASLKGTFIFSFLFWFFGFFSNVRETKFQCCLTLFIHKGSLRGRSYQTIICCIMALWFPTLWAFSHRACVLLLQRPLFRTRQQFSKINCVNSKHLPSLLYFFTQRVCIWQGCLLCRHVPEVLWLLQDGKPVYWFKEKRKRGIFHSSLVAPCQTQTTS